jgi:hypothetical protein
VTSRAETDAAGFAAPRKRTFGCVLAFKGDLAAFRCQPVPAEGLRLGPATTVRLRVRPATGVVPRDLRVRLLFPGGNCRHGLDPVSATDGVYTFPPLPADRTSPERTQVEIAAPGWWGGPYDLPVALADGTTEVVVARSRNVRGFVLDEAGNPVEGVDVWATNPARPWDMEGVVSGSKGEFALTDVPAGPARAYARARGFAPCRIDLPAGETDHDAGNVVVKRGVPLVARVIEEDGVDVVSYAVFVEDESGARIDRAQCDGRGRFSTGALEAVPVRVRAFVHGSVGVEGWRSTTAELVPGQPDQTVTIPTGLRIRLADADGKPKRVRSAKLSLRAAGGNPEIDRYEGSFSEVRIHVRAQLEIEVSVDADDGSSGTATVTTDANGRGTVDVRLATR